MGKHRRLVAASALVTLCVFPLLGASCSMTTQDYTGPPEAPKMYVVGDSITYQMTDELNARFQPDYQVRIDGWSGRSSLMMASRAEAAAATSPDVVIVELGTNDPNRFQDMTFEQSVQWLEAINSYFAPTTCVVYVTPWSGTVERRPGALAAIATFERGRFTRVADWDAAVTPEDYADGDNVHPNSTGRQDLVQLEAAVVSTCPAPEPPPG